MPPSLASCLTVLFILWLFYQNAKRGLRVSHALWLPTIWVCTLASRPLGCWFGDADQSASAPDGSPIDRNVLLLLIISAIFVLMRRGINWGEAIRSNRWLAAFYLYLLVSVVWSDYPFIAFKRWFREFGDLLMILVIFTEEDPAEAVTQVFVRCAYILVPVSILLIKYYPTLGRAYDYWTGQPFICGVGTNKNVLGRLAMLSGICLLWSVIANYERSWFKWLRKNVPELLILGMCFWMLHAANSQTSIGCFALAVAIFFGFRMRWTRENPTRLAWCGGTLIVLSLLVFCFPSLRQIVTSSMGRQVNLTDRTDVWSAVMAAGTDPIIGTGFASFWLTNEGIATGNKLDVTEAHNGFLETYLNGGVIGVGLLVAALLVAGRNVLKQFAAGNSNAPFYAALFFACLVYNYTEADFNTNSTVGFVLWMLAMRHETTRDTETVDPAIPVDDSGPKSSPGLNRPSIFATTTRKDA